LANKLEDVAKCNLLAGLQTRSDIYNCGYGDKVTFNHIFEIITSFYKNNSKIEYIKQPYSFFQVSTCASITKTSNNLQYYPSFDIYTGIKEYISHSRAENRGLEFN
jgi:nucleoside-diphosphate-sugar epimerase